MIYLFLLYLRIFSVESRSATSWSEGTFPGKSNWLIMFNSKQICAMSIERAIGWSCSAPSRSEHWCSVLSTISLQASPLFSLWASSPLSSWPSSQSSWPTPSYAYDFPTPCRHKKSHEHYFSPTLIRFSWHSEVPKIESTKEKRMLGWVNNKTWSASCLDVG